MKNYIPKNKYVLLLIFFVLSALIYIIIEHFKEQDIETYKTQSYNENILAANIYLSTLIKEKENATTTIGLGLSKNEHIVKALKERKTTGKFLQDYSKRLAENTDFKNVWFQLIASDGTSIDRSWTDIKNDNIAKVRDDLQRTLKDKVIVNSISVGRFDLTFKSIVPILDADNKTFLGAVEVITHFNSISQRLEDKKIFAVVLADKVYKKQLIYPSSKTFIGDYYVANANVKKSLLAYFRTLEMGKYLEYFKNNDYFVDYNLQSVVSYYPLNDAVNNKQLGHILLVQDIKNIDANSINYINYIYNIYFLFAIIALMLVVYLTATIEIKNLTGKAHSFDILLYIFIVYVALAVGIYNLLSIKYDGDIESYNQNITSQTLLEYNSIVEKNKDIADFIYDGVVNTPKIIHLFKEKEREELYDSLLSHYKQMGLKYSIRQLHFHLPDSSSFLRMHKKELYGDSLVGIRESVEYVNKTLKPFYGFEEGRVYNGFRYVYPVFDEDGKHLGSAEVSFDIKSFMDNYMKFFDAKRVNFLISEKVIKDKVFISQQSNYKKSPINGFLFDRVVSDSLAIKNTKNTRLIATDEQFNEISQKIKIGTPFTIHFENMHEIAIFIPIVNKISGEIVACLSVSKEDTFIQYRLDELHQVMIVVMIILVFIMFFVYREFLSKKRAQAELENNQKILDSQNSFIIITDGYEIKRVNKTFLLFFDYKNIEEFKEEHSCICDFFVYEKGKNYVLKEMDDVNWFEYIKDPLCKDKQVKIYDKDKGEHIFYIEINFDDTLEDGNYIVTFIDITHLKSIEDQLFYSEKMVSLGNMIGNIAHQWRQPLSVISTCASGIAMKHEYGILKDQDIEPNMEMIVQNTKYLSETIDIFRDFIKESGDKEQRKVSIGEVISITLSIMEASLKNHYINVIYTEPSEKYYKTMAKGEFSQVITNLINNSKDVLLERKVENPTITIEFEKIANHLVVTIEDNGGGIGDDIIKNVFEPYFTTKHKSKGTGLGLYICHKIVTESLGGKIYVKNGEFGAKFFIEIEID
jgi:nitrogen-specific signal transduction histidine kinase